MRSRRFSSSSLGRQCDWQMPRRDPEFPRYRRGKSCSPCFNRHPSSATDLSLTSIRREGNTDKLAKLQGSPASKSSECHRKLPDRREYELSERISPMGAPFADWRSWFCTGDPRCGDQADISNNRFPDSNSMFCFRFIRNTLYEFRYGEEMKNRHMAHGLLANSHEITDCTICSVSHSRNYCPCCSVSKVFS
jgi:hypothetical protein